MPDVLKEEGEMCFVMGTGDAIVICGMVKWRGHKFSNAN
jgi:hypothetical protein